MKDLKYVFTHLKLNMTDFLDSLKFKTDQTEMKTIKLQVSGRR